MSNFRFSVGRRIGAGFTILILLTLVAFILTNKTLNSSRNINDQINQIYNPSVAVLEELNLMTLRSKMYIGNWVNQQKEEHDKAALRKLITKEYPNLKKKIYNLSNNWKKEEQNEVVYIFKEIDSLYSGYQDIMQQLNTFESYEDPTIIFLIKPTIEANGDWDLLARRITNNLNHIISIHQENAIEVSEEMIKSFDLLQNIVRSLGFALVFGGILIAIFTIRSIVKPVRVVRAILLKMAKGVVPEDIHNHRNDEIGDMTNALNLLIDGTKRTVDFAKQIGSGDFGSDYKPLSEQDSLGISLLAMRKDLTELTSNLEQKVKERTEEVVKQSEEIETQRKKLSFLYEQQTDSIKYAKRLQDAILPPKSHVKKVLPDSFILFKPKDIVSGDFYWVEKKGNKVFFAAVDCTGHGVPGAFMSLIGHNVLKQSLMKLDNPSPADMMDELSRGIVATLHQGRKDNTTKDGMDLTICCIDYELMTLEFAGAFNPLYFVRNGELSETKVDKMSIGSFVADEQNRYTNFKLQLQKGDAIYITSDGYCDQFGGPKGKKFMAARFRELLINIYQNDIDDQKHTLNKAIEEWKGHEEQVDDILVIGVKI